MKKGNLVRLKAAGYIDCFEGLSKPTCGCKGLDYIWAKGIENYTDSYVPDMEWKPDSMAEGYTSSLLAYGSDHLPISTFVNVKVE